MIEWQDLRNYFIFQIQIQCDETRQINNSILRIN